MTLMKTIKHLSFIVVLATMMCSCGTLFNFTTLQEQAQGIKPGMTSREVRSILGDNFYLSFHNNNETWEYRTNPQYHDYSVVKIEFKDGRVVCMDSYMEVNPAIQEDTTRKIPAK